MMVGVQGSGKSSFSSKHFKDYVIVSNDKSGNREKSLTLMKNSLAHGKSVVIDNTHVNPEARQKFIEIAKNFGVPIRCFVMNTSLGQVRHNIVFREITDKNHVHIGEPLINGYMSKYKEPTMNEGFTEIVKVNIIPEFKYNQLKLLYFFHLVEK